MSDQRRESHLSQDGNTEREVITSPDLQKRDPTHLNTHLKLMFEDIFAEPHSSVHSYDRVWSSSFKVFRTTRSTSYRVTSLICAVPASVFWGGYFAFLTCCSIWCCLPCIRALDIKLHCVREVWSQFVDACIRPCTEVLGQCFGSLRIVLHRSDEQQGFTI